MQINHNRSKSRQDRLKQAKKRFQFDPNKIKQSQQLHKSLVKHKTSSAISIMGTSQLPSSIQCVDVDSRLYEQKENILSKKLIINDQSQKNQVIQIKTSTQYSSVNPDKNQKFEFENQSSWLANLVDGIQDLYTKPVNKIIEISQRQYKGNLQESSHNQKSSSLASSNYCFSKKKHSFNQETKPSSKSATKDLRTSQSNQYQKDRGYEHKVKSKTINSKNSESYHTSKRNSTFNFRNQPVIKRTKSKPDIHLNYKQNVSTHKERGGANGKTEKNQNYCDQKYENNLHKCPNPIPNAASKKILNNTPTKRSVASLSVNRKQSAPCVSSVSRATKNNQQKKQIQVQAKHQSKEKERLKIRCSEMIQPSDKAIQNKQKLPDLRKQQIKINNNFKAHIRKNSKLLEQKQETLIKSDMSQQPKQRQHIGGIRKNINRSLIIADLNADSKPNNAQNNLAVQKLSSQIDNQGSEVGVTGRFNEKGRIKHIKPQQADKRRKFEYKLQNFQCSSQKRFEYPINPTRQILQFKQNQQKYLNRRRVEQKSKKLQTRQSEDKNMKIRQSSDLLRSINKAEQCFKEQKQKLQIFNLPKQKIIDIFYKLNPNNQKHLTSELIKKNQQKLFPNNQNNQSKDKIMQSIIRSIFIELRISKANFTLEQFVHFMTKIALKFNHKSESKIGQIIQTEFSNEKRERAEFQLRHLNERKPSYKRSIGCFRLLDEKQQTKQSQFQTKFQTINSQLFAKIQIKQPELCKKGHLQTQKSFKEQKAQTTFGRINLRQILPLTNCHSSYNSIKQEQQNQKVNDDKYSKIYTSHLGIHTESYSKPNRSEYNCDAFEKYPIDERLNRIHNKYGGNFRNYRPMNQENNSKPEITQFQMSIPVAKQNLPQNYVQLKQKFEVGRSKSTLTRFQIERLQLIKSRNRQLHQKLVTFNNATNSSVQESNNQKQQIPDRNNYIQQMSESSEDKQQKQESNKSFIFPVIVQEDEQDGYVPVKEPYLQMNSTAVLQIDQQKVLKSMGLMPQLQSQKQRRSLSNSQAIQLIYKMSEHPQIRQISRNYDQKPVLKQLQKYRYDKQLFESEPWTVRNPSQNSWRNSAMLNTMGCKQNKGQTNIVNQQLSQNTYSIIEKLNLKLSKYIQTNRLSSSQNFLQFNFSQLRKNLKI